MCACWPLDGERPSVSLASVHRKVFRQGTRSAAGILAIGTHTVGQTVALSWSVHLAMRAFMTLCVSARQRWLSARVQKPDKAGAKRKKAKKKGSMADSLAVLRSSPKILNLALLVMSYGVSHRLFEFAWKGQLAVLYPSAQQYQVQRPKFIQYLSSTLHSRHPGQCVLSPGLQCPSTLGEKRSLLRQSNNPCQCTVAAQSAAPALTRTL